MGEVVDDVADGLGAEEVELAFVFFGELRSDWLW